MDAADGYLIQPEWDDIPSRDRPDTPIEALMRADFADEPAESTVERLARRQRVRAVLDKAMECLTPQEQQAVVATVVDQISLRELADMMQRPGGGHYGKTWIAQLRDNALNKLREEMSKPEMLQALAEAQTGTVEEGKDIDHGNDDDRRSQENGHAAA